ncbi:hypothetical protein DXG01_002148 [Tephrocybe rancida]|nr:hypothetical protein DXG01_002148 [Tephrocybe rancida]
MSLLVWFTSSYFGSGSFLHLQVVRYTALFTGVVYGFYHRRTLQANHDQQKVEHAVHTRERLVAEAKEAWKRRNEAKNSNVITDTEDPRFDLEKLLLSFDKAS